MAHINAPVIPDAVMLDRVIGLIQQGLVDNIPWLDAAFGRSQRLEKMIKGKRVITPNVFCGGWKGHGPNDYIEVSPDSKIGNFAFFEVEDPQTIDAGPWARQIKTPFSLIVWFDTRRVYNVASNRNLERLKAEILHVLNGRAGWQLTEGRIIINRIYDRCENIYRGYSLSEIDNQFLMHPFAGFRFDGLLVYDELCIPYYPPIEKTLSIAWEIGQYNTKAKITHIVGNSAVVDGVLVNNVTDKLVSIGPNLIDPKSWVQGRFTQIDGDFEFVSDNKYYTTSPFPIPKRQTFYLKCPQSLFVRVRAAGGESAAVDISGATPNATFDMTGFAKELCDKMVLEIERKDINAIPRIGLNISNPAVDGTLYQYWKDELQLNITTLQGVRNGQIAVIFPDGLKSCGNVADMIVSGQAVKRVGTRPYAAGDENDPELLTDGTTTNYPLPELLVYRILETENVLRMELNGNIYRLPAQDNTPLIIEYYDS